MIYLIRSYGKGGKSLLKIGFTAEDNDTGKRIEQYFYYNPLCEVICTIHGGTEEHKSKLHYKFKEHLVRGREWFEDKDEIVNYIKSATLKDLDQLPLKKLHTRLNNKSLIKKWSICKLLEYVLRGEGKDITVDNLENMLKVVKYKSTTPELIFLDLQQSNHYPSIQSKTWEEVEKLLYPSINSEVDKFFEVYDQLTTYVDKIHCIVDFILENPHLQEPILNNLVDSDKIKQQLITVGPERIKGLGYHMTKINRAMGITIFDKSTFMNEIYNSFEIGKKYTKKYIKEELGEIYKSADFKGTPKANDLDKWFELREVRMTVDGKKVPGFEIVKKK